jgi:hypothetical protein
MRCSVFKNKLYDYMEDNLQNDMKKAMEEHMEKCESCKTLYEEEKRTDEIIKNTLSLDDIGFKSSRSNIMKSINKKKYTGTMTNRIELHVKKYGKRYLSAVAVFAIIVVSSSFLFYYMKSDSIDLLKKEAASTSRINDNTTIKSEGNGIVTSSTSDKVADTTSVTSKSEVSKGSSASINTSTAYIPKFKKVISEKDPEKDFTTGAKSSPDGKLKAQLDGRGLSSADEGVADIFIAKDNSEKWRLQVTDNAANFTPMYLAWLDNENVLITMGYANGHATYGGNVYKVNVLTGVASLVYEVDSNKEQVAVVERVGSTLKLTVKVFVDDIKNQTKDVERVISIPQ